MDRGGGWGGLDPAARGDPQSLRAVVVAAARGPLQQVVDSTVRGEYIFKLRLTQKPSQLTDPYRDGDDRSLLFISLPWKLLVLSGEQS